VSEAASLLHSFALGGPSVTGFVVDVVDVVDVGACEVPHPSKVALASSAAEPTTPRPIAWRKNVRRSKEEVDDIDATLLPFSDVATRVPRYEVVNK
jgi:hypothetical protein